MYDQINASLATLRHFRPAWSERYSLDAAWSEDKVAAFESLHHCRLPDEYREFLLRVGVAGAGPDYGLFAPDQHFTGSGYEECWCDDPDLSQPFPHRDAWNVPHDSLDDLDVSYYTSQHCPGSLMISDRGCALLSRIIITGPLAGQIWHDDRGDGAGLHPCLSEDGQRMSFLRWYLDWLDAEVYRYGHAGNPR